MPLFAWIGFAAIFLVVGAVIAQEQQPHKPTAAELNTQLLENEVRNYRGSVAQLAEQNQKLTDEVAELKKKCAVEPSK